MSRKPTESTSPESTDPTFGGRDAKPEQIRDSARTKSAGSSQQPGSRNDVTNRWAPRVPTDTASVARPVVSPDPPRRIPEQIASKSPTGLVADRPAALPDVSIRERIAILAYSYWEARGHQGGSPEEDWFRAEREVLRQQSVNTRV